MGREHHLVGGWSERHAFVSRPQKFLLKSIATDAFPQKFAPAKSIILDRNLRTTACSATTQSTLQEERGVW